MRSAEINRGLPGTLLDASQSRKLPLLYYPELVLVEADSYLPAYMFYPGIVPVNNIVEPVSRNVADGYLAVSWIDISIKNPAQRRAYPHPNRFLNGQLSCSQVNNFRFNAVYRENWSHQQLYSDHQQ